MPVRDSLLCSEAPRADAAGEPLRALAGRVEAAREEERTRLARELHDELGQQLTALRLDIGWLARRMGDGAEVRERLRAIGELLDGAFSSIRRISADLRPGILDDLGLFDALVWQARDFEQRSGVRVTIEALMASTELLALSHGQSTALFRVFQELLTNVARHAGATQVRVRLEPQGRMLVLGVRDDGRGILPEEAVNHRSLGLLGMRERAALHGGSFRIRRHDAGGTVATWSLRLMQESA